MARAGKDKYTLGQIAFMAKSKIGLVAKVSLGFFFMAAVLFLPAGTILWPEAWLFIFVMLAYAAVAITWGRKNSPRVIEERAKFKIPKKAWDKAMMAVMSIAIITIFAIAGYDSMNLGLSKMPLPLKVLGFVGLALGLNLNLLVIKENAYLSRIVQKKEGHKVVTTGPYSAVRHPLYAASIIIFLSSAFALGSFYALLPGAITAIALITRTELDDKALKKELPGYKEYSKKVKWKLVPGIW